MALIPVATPKERVCKKCKTIKFLSEFKNEKGCHYGKAHTCNSCYLDHYRKRYYTRYWKNPEKFRQRVKIYRESPLGKIATKIQRDKQYKKIHNSPDGLYKIYKSSARKYNRYFNLSLNNFIQWFNNTDCYYCFNRINTIGLDRVNNENGYTMENVVPCCSTCNYMKRHLKQSDFFKHILKIADRIRVRN